MAEHSHAEELARLNAGAESARKHGRHATAERKQTEAARLAHHVQEYHKTWTAAVMHSH